MRKAWRAHPEVPISKAVRAGDFVFTSAYGPWTFDPRKVVFAPDGSIVDDGTGLKDMPFDEQVERTVGFVRDALESAGCSLRDVVECRAWLADARDFVRFNEIYQTFFPEDPPVRSVFPTQFMFLCRLEMQVTAYKPLA
jgi:2-iminobutanoate/2-iminopropanoate deaminase